VGYGGELVAVMQFFGTADKNAGPITKVVVDWNAGPGTSKPTTGRYKNHLGREGCNNSDFAHSAGACTEDHFYFTNTYNCPSDAASTVSACTSDSDSNCFASVCPEDVNGAVAGTGSCCVFKPRVQLTDNWGWCNGDCEGAGRGCYLSDCDLGDVQPHWTPFAGKVIVVPK
jgi:hypothetical protein